MSDIILPPGRQPNPDENKPRPSNDQTLAFIEQQRQEQEARMLEDKIMAEEMNSELSERRKKQLAVAVQIVMVQLDGDAKLLEAVAKEPNTTLADMHDKIQMARCFRVTMGWLQGLVATQQAVDNAKEQKPDNQ